jgi:ABC-type antimicrobial peptide transport system permease subunit
VVVRTTSDPAAAVGGIRDALRAIDPDLPLGEVQTLDERLWETTATQRTRELGVRMALGATPHDVLRMVVRETARLAGLGTAIGLVLALGAGRFMASVLFAVSPSDGLTFMGTSTVLLLAALIAGLLPAWRAATTDPVVALRAE